MSQLFYLSAEQLERIKPFFPLSHGIPRVDDLKVISGIIIFTELAETAGKDRRLMIDAPPPQGPSYRSKFDQKRALSRCIGRTKGGLNSKLHAVCDGHGRPLAMTLTEGQVSDCKGAALLMDALPEARELLADRGYDADWLRDALLARGITPCIPPRKNRKRPISYDKELYEQRHKIEIMFGRIKDWRRIAMRYDRCAHTFFSALCLATSISINEV